MAATRTCPKCGAEVTGEALGGLCPNCVAVLALGPDPDPPRNAGGSVPSSEKPGDCIDRYKLLEKIGEGGCGVVYMAEQEEPVRRRVALKVIKLGMDTRQVIARFEAERQALALMDHPNIAKVHDAGATETGRPYFVMELVKGIPITRYCDENGLTTERRLRLFIQVCQAIQHAHQKGVIHRDIKPSNILVADHDGVPVPKVIDFGIAKATTDQCLTDKTLFTVFEQFMGTPAFMSPEQANLSGVDVDTRSDIYSLGVLLYELLTGRTPFEAKRLLDAGLDEVRRIIREEEPLRPSTRLETLNKEQQTTVAKDRRSEPPKLLGLIRGDLDWIAMKCLEKDRTRRYETANGLAADIVRHLNDEPVVARPPSKVYRFQKMARRNKLAFAAAGAVAAALIIGLAIALWQSIEKTHAYNRAIAAEQGALAARSRAEANEKKARASEQQAMTEAVKSRQISAFLQEMFRRVDPNLAGGQDTTLLREILDHAAAQVEATLKDQPEVKAELLYTLGFVYNRISETAKAEAAYREAVEIERKLMASGPSDELAAKLSDWVEDLGAILSWQGKLAEAESAARESLALRRKLYGNESRLTAYSLATLAWTLASVGKLEEAEALEQESLATRRKLTGDESWETAMSLGGLSRIRRHQGRLAEAEDFVQQQVAITKKVFGTSAIEVAFYLNDLTGVLLAEGKFPEAVTASRESAAIQKKLYHDDVPPPVDARRDLGYALWKEGNLGGAEEVYRDMLLSRRGRLGSGNPAVIEALNDLVRVLQAQNKNMQVEQVLDDWLKATSEGQPQRVGILRMQMEYFARHGRWKEALADATKLVELEPNAHLNYHCLAPLQAQVGDLRGYRQTCQRAAAQFRETKDLNTAERIAKDCLLLPSSGIELETAARMAETAVSAAATNHPDITWFQFCKGLAEYRQEHFVSAADWTQKALSHAGDDFTRDVEAYMVLAMAQYSTKQAAEASAALAKGLEIADRNLLKLDSGDIGDGWLDWIIAHALMREAKALIEGNASAASPP